MDTSFRLGLPAAVAVGAFFLVTSCEEGSDKKQIVIPTGTTTSTGGQGGEGGETAGGSGGEAGQPPSCDDDELNGQETDVDCGGPDCGPTCMDGQMCMSGPDDCTSGQCTNMICTSVSCMNRMQDGDETDVDCGGMTGCNRCMDGQMCLEDSDCLNLSCPNQICLPPSCMDMAQNGAETDVNCGGPDCPACSPGQGCLVNIDCDSFVCLQLVCQQPQCDDGVQNGSETDVDCGGGCTGLCPPGQGCMSDSDCVTGDCDTQLDICICPAEMVIMPIFGGGAYCIDEAEVTRSQYNLFWIGNPTPDPNLPMECIGNNRTPGPLAWPPATMEDFQKPVVQVDWCDAWEYCAASQKHLCGNIDGGANDPAFFADFNESEWFNACSAQGMNDYPYGALFSPGTCNDSGSDVIEVVPPPPTGCIGGAAGLMHMSGNAREWEDSCDMMDNCLLRGGSYLANQSPQALRCDAFSTANRLSTPDDVSFRCCL